MFFPIRDDQPRFSTPVVNYFIIALNVLVFLFELSVEGQGPRALNALVMQFGVVPRHFELALAGSGRYTLAGVALTIFTSMFMHASFMHIIGNMWVLWIFGDNVEDYLGHAPYLIFYLLCGFIASITHILFNAASTVPSVGASGAIAGVMGAYFLLYPRAKVLTWVIFIFFWWLPAWIWLGCWFALQFFSGAATSVAYSNQTSGGIAFMAHVGGFVAGLILIKIFPQRTRTRRYASW
jgi:membrane associated rhomboid family serine protease